MRARVPFSFSDTCQSDAPLVAMETTYSPWTDAHRPPSPRARVKHSNKDIRALFEPCLPACLPLPPVLLRFRNRREKEREREKEPRRESGVFSQRALASRVNASDVSTRGWPRHEAKRSDTRSEVIFRVSVFVICNDASRCTPCNIKQCTFLSLSLSSSPVQAISDISRYRTNERRSERTRIT